jgi:putative membrane protein
MRGILIRMLVTAAGLWLASVLLPGVQIEGYGTLLLAALLYGIVNAVVRPIVVLLTLPITVLSLGLFLFVVNAAMFGLVAAMLAGFSVAGFFSAIFGAVIVSIVSISASWYIGPDGRYEVIVIQTHSRN